MRRALRIVGWACVAGVVAICLLVGWYSAADRWQRRTVTDYAILANLTPIRHTAIDDSDYVEYQILGGWGGAESVRVYGDGGVERDGTMLHADGFVSGCPLHSEDQHIRIDGKKARELIAETRDDGFFRLSGSYRAGTWVYDAGSEWVTLHVGRQTRTVFDHAGEPPPLFGKTIGRIKEATLPWPAYMQHPDAAREKECRAFDDQQDELDRKRHPERYKDE